MTSVDTFRALIGDAHVLTGKDTAKWDQDWIGKYTGAPQAVLRPRTTQEVSAILKQAHATNTPITPVSGNTGLAGGAFAPDGILLSLDRMNTIREIRPDARLAIVEAGVILSSLHDAAEGQGLVFPLTLGAKGSALIGGCLSTNAGGSNVLRYGNMRDLCLGLEVVLPNGEVMNLMSELHKDNSGYNLKHLFIGGEGTLGIITAAVLKLAPKPAAYATAMVASPSLPDALVLLNRLQSETGGAVEAFEYMPRSYIDQHLSHFPNAQPPFEQRYDVNILVEIGATAPKDAALNADGQPMVEAHLEEVLMTLLEDGLVLDAVVAKNSAQRLAMWQRREDAGEVALSRHPLVNTDIAVPLDHVAVFLDKITPRLAVLDPKAQEICVAHLGDGNIHHTVYPSTNDPDRHDAIMETVEDLTRELGGTFSAEHGIGLTKKPSMIRQKDKVALATMWAVKKALDPKNIMNPGKVLPPL